MLAKVKMQEIQDLKLQGYTKADIIACYEARGEKAPSRPTINKYYDMDVIPDDPGEKLSKEKSFDVEPFKSAIIVCLPSTMCWKKNLSRAVITKAFPVMSRRCGTLSITSRIMA